jgi:hypothetical protein
MKRAVLVATLAMLAVAAASGADRDDRHVLTERASVRQPANLTRTAVELSRRGGRTIFGVYAIAGDGSNGAIGTLQPAAGSFDEATGATRAGVQINLPPNGHPTTAIANAGHDAPAAIVPGDGSLLVTYGAASTYVNYHPPQSWACLRGQYCEPYKRALLDQRNVPDALARAPEQLLPASGLSEMSFATLGDATIMAGQQQTGTPAGDAGAQGYVTYLAGNHFETAGDGDGLYTIARAPSDDAYVEFAVSAASGVGSIGVSIGDVHCTLANLPASDPAQAAQAFVQYANAACPAFRNRYEAMLARYAPAEKRFGGAAIGIALRSGNVLALPPAQDVRLQCDGGIHCISPAGPNRVLDVRRSGLHRHFLFGGVMRAGRYIYDILDIEEVTGSWYGTAENSYGLGLACFRTDQRSGPVWTWTDCGGRHPFELRPGVAPQDRLSPGSPYLIGAPPGGFPPSMTPFARDWSMRSQPPAGPHHVPVIASESATLLRDGTLLLAYGCQTADGDDAICDLTMDRDGRTTRAGIVAAGASGGSLPEVAVQQQRDGTVMLAALVGVSPRWQCPGTGACALLYRYDARSGEWTRTASRPLGGVDNAGFAGTVAPENGGFVVLYRELLDASHARILTFMLR